jgi:hypothetical protein
MTDFALPSFDPALDALDEASRKQLSALWLSRAHNEFRTSSVFADLHRTLLEFGANFEILGMSAAAVSDEMRHAAICRDVATRYAGTECAVHAVSAPASPIFSVCSARVARALYAALHCSVNETLAATYLGACLAEVESTVAKTALREIIQDEVRHARIGWAVLASDQLSPADRATISNTMPVLLDVCVSEWLRDIEDEFPDALCTGHGAIRHRGIASLVDDTLTNVVAPGLDHVRIDSTPARAWIAANRRST